jgi:recombination protein RecA
MSGKSFDDVIREAERKYDLRVSTLADIAEDVSAYSTGNLAIDHLTGVGGVPVGRSIEMYGPPSCGKTTTAVQTCVTLQRIIKDGGNIDPALGPLVTPDSKIVYFDYEHATDPNYLTALGLDIEHPSFRFAQPSTLEQGANVARALVETGEARLIVWDSIAAAVPSPKAEAEIGKSLPAVAAKLYADFLSSLNEPLHRNNCTAIFVNHLAEAMTMGQRPGMPPLTTTPGGRALKFYASVRLEFKQQGSVKEKYIDPLTKEEIEQVTATNVRVKVVKNKVGPPFRQALVRVRWGKGFDNFWSALQVLIAHRRIVFATGGYFYFEKSPDLVHEEMSRQTTGNKRPYVRGEKAIFDFADTHAEWREQVIAAAVAVLDEEPEPMGVEVQDMLVEDKTAHGTAQVDPVSGLIMEDTEVPDGELISPKELDQLTSFIPKLGATAATNKLLTEADVSTFTDDLLNDV